MKKELKKQRNIRMTDTEYIAVLKYLESHRKNRAALLRGSEEVVSVSGDVMTGVPVNRMGVSPDVFLKQYDVQPLPPEEPSTNEPEEDFADMMLEWRNDYDMMEIDRAINYETDAYGYPEVAIPVSRRWPTIWVELHNTKSKNNARYNELMTELHKLWKGV